MIFINFLYFSSENGSGGGGVLLVSKIIYLRYFTTLKFYCFHFNGSTLDLKTPKILVVLSFVDE